MPDYRLQIHGTFATGRRWTTRVHMTSASDIGTVAALWAANVVVFWSGATSGVNTLYPVGTVMTGSSVALLNPVFRETLKIDSPSTNPGTSVADSEANQTAIVVSLRTPGIGKSQRGRMYLPAPATDSNVGGELTAPLATRMSTSIHTLFDAMRSSGGTFFVYNAKVHVNDPVQFTKKTITIEEVDRILRTQRRRIRKSLAVYV